mgnify:CR=1 FL=1
MTLAEHRHSAPVRAFLFVGPYLLAFCLGAFCATFFFERWIPGSMRASAARNAENLCRLAADACKKSCEP